MFGPIEEFKVYNEAWGMLTGSVKSAYGAIVDGEMSAGQAVKAFLKDSLKAMGSRMAIRGLEEIAEGFAAMANPNPVWGAKSAAAHFTSAAKFGLGAAAAGVAASQIGGGSGGGSGGARPAAPNTSGGSGGRNGGSDQAPIIIVYGQDFVNSSARQRQLHARKMVKDAGLMGGDA